MAAIPSLSSITMEALSDLQEDAKPGFKTFIEVLNPFLKDTVTAFGTLTFGNFTGVYKTVSVVVPAETWTTATLINGWTALGSGFDPPAYMITEAGIVTLRGSATGGTTTPGTAMFTLPTGYRPAAPILFPVVISNAFGRIDIPTNGNVQYTTGVSAASVSFYGIRFYSDAAGPAAAPAAYVGAGWPIQLASGLKTPPTDVRLVQAKDLATGTNFASGAYTPNWVVDSNNNVIINRIGGLSPGRKYQLTFLILGNS